MDDSREIVLARPKIGRNEPFCLLLESAILYFRGLPDHQNHLNSRQNEQPPKPKLLEKLFRRT
jgi:hypothetical protein